MRRPFIELSARASEQGNLIGLVSVYIYVCVQCFCNWASEASPTLRCSIEISRDIYICWYVCRILGGITYAHAQSQFWAVKTDL